MTTTEDVATEIWKGLLTADIPLLTASNWYDPATVMLRSAKVATPLALVLTAEIPPSSDVPPFTPIREIETVTSTTGFEPASVTITVTGGLITAPACALEGS